MWLVKGEGGLIYAQDKKKVRYHSPEWFDYIHTTDCRYLSSSVLHARKGDDRLSTGRPGTVHINIFKLQYNQVMNQLGDISKDRGKKKTSCQAVKATGACLYNGNLSTVNYKHIAVE